MMLVLEGDQKQFITSHSAYSGKVYEGTHLLVIGLLGPLADDNDYARNIWKVE